MKVLKCWINGWITSFRMHEPELKDCLLGCSGEPDSLQHYLVCPHLFAFNQFFRSGQTSPLPLVRWGLANFSDDSINNYKFIACSFAAYHAVKNQCKSKLESLQSRWSLFADAYRAEAVSLGLNVRAFTHPQFISFLTVDLPSITN